MKIKEEDRCDYCAQRENIQHKFWSCSRVSKFWDEIKAWLILERLDRLAGKVTAKEVILGGDGNLLFNHVISVAIYMIYAKKQLSVELLKRLLMSDRTSEKYGAKLKDKMNSFVKKWEVLNCIESAE